MDAKTEDGGYAYPTHAAHGNQPGMTLRDYFAGLALAALVAAGDEGAGDRLTEVPAYAYQIADAMLAARGRK
jgi:hypothetical protein